MRAKPIGPTSPEKTVWWRVDLGGLYNIYSVNILFKNGEGMYSNELWLNASKGSLSEGESWWVTSKVTTFLRTTMV